MTVGEAIRRRLACAPCMTWYDSEPHLVGAAASVGIEHGRSTQYMLAAVISRYHDSGHVEH